MASASRGFSFWLGVSALAVIGLVQVQNDRLALAVRFLDFLFVENRIGDHVLFARPVSQVPHPAPFAAKRKIFMRFGVSRRFADGASVNHGYRSFGIYGAAILPRECLAYRLAK